MIYNLLHERWIPVLRQDNTREWIRPCDITSNPSNPVIRIDSDRADFNGAYIQFLIALLQTCCAPDIEDNLIEMPWKDWYENPPSPEVLQDKFIIYVKAFNLNGEYPRFMQDQTAVGGLQWELYKILIDGFGASSHFSKYDNVQGISYSTAAIALVSHQWNTTNSLAGSKNQHRSSLRNGGFLTTILIPSQSTTDNSQRLPTLWETLWMNILPQNELNSYCGNPDKDEVKNKFPWMGPTRISDKDGRDTFPDDEHPLTMYWATPRRVHLYFNGDTGVCSITPNGEEALVKHFDVKPDGFNYKDWIHPLTPIRYDDKNFPIGFYKTSNNGVRYNHWLGLVQKSQSKGANIIITSPAKIVEYYKTGRFRKRTVPHCRIVGFGFSNDNAKIESYRYGEMPLIHVAEDVVEDFEQVVKKMIDSSTQVVYHLRDCCKALVGMKAYSEKEGRFQWNTNPQKSNKESGIIASAEISFWNNTEQPFYSFLSKIAEILHENDDVINGVKSEWLTILQKTALEIFDNLAESVSPDLQDMCSIVRARQELVWYLYGTKKKNELNDILFK